MKRRDLNTYSRNTRDITRPEVVVKGIVSKRNAKQNGLIILLKHSVQCQKVIKGKEAHSHLSLSEWLTANTRRI